MITSLRRSCVAAAAAFAVPWCAPALAQSLSLSYQLDPVNAPASARSHPIVDRCSGLSWAASLAAACFVQASARAPLATTPPPAPVPETKDLAAAPRKSAADSYTATETAASSLELPVLGSPADARLLRAAGRDAYIGTAKAVDLNFRFGSKYRMRSGEDGWELYKFSDVTSENRTQSNGMRNLGVELLFPFQ
ncbi:MAG: hypothetical protein JWM26_3849 [Betaproteobacteria bacterium]|nr:hypothetical protein [Betaproteobacteria bacterium]